MIKKVILVISVILVIFFLSYYLINYKEENKKDIIMYSWHENEINNEMIDKLKQYDINTIYQYFDNKIDKDKVKLLVDNKIKVYSLSGEREWGLENKPKSMKNEIDKVVSFNKKNRLISGVVFDVETYLIDSENFDYELYLKNVKKIYDYAKENDVEMILCIPTWFEKYGRGFLKQLVKHSDEISLMNYDTKYTLKNIENEIKYAKKYNKKINTIYDIDFNNKNNYFKSKEEIEKDYNELEDYYKYEELRIAYHHYSKIK